MIKSLLIFSLLCWALSTPSNAQSDPRYLILFKDKAASPFSVEKPSDYLSERAILRRSRQNISIQPHDLPVNPAYLTAVRQTGARVIYPTKWFNGALVEASKAQLDAIKKLPFYKGTELNLPVANITFNTPGISRNAATNRKFETEEELDYGNMNAQLALMEVPVLHQAGFRGEGMIIAVIDNGFRNGDQLAFLKQLRDEKRVLDTHDFVGRETNVYNDGSHGLAVLSTIAAYEPGSMIGAAFKASYLLYRSENDDAESPYEEITWLLAAERADSAGADVVNTSLGYYEFENEFNTPDYNYTYEDMDGHTTIISRAARVATRTGMLMVASAGNEGNKAWRYISAPADVDSVLTVGATGYDRSYGAFSSIGPNAAGAIKPDVAAVGVGAVIGSAGGSAVSGNGTSYSSPIMAGLAAILWQAHPNLTAQQVISVLKKSGHQAAAPDNLLGYGVPSVTKAEEIIATEFDPLGTEDPAQPSLVVSPNPAESELVLHIPAKLAGKNADLEIFNAGGTRFSGSREMLHDRHVIETAHLKTGLYLLRINVEGFQKTIRFVRK